MTPTGKLETWSEFVADEFDFIFDSEQEAQASLDKLEQALYPID